MTNEKYNNRYSPENLYGHVIALMKAQYSEHAEGSIHLDIACGFGAIGEVVEAELDVKYVGIDLDPEAVAALRARGLEAHEMDLTDGESALAILDLAVAGRQVSSISVLDGIEHFTDAAPLLRAIRAIAARDHAFLVVSIPNVTHRDIANKLAFGAWAYSPTGLLDETHVHLFGEAELTTLLESNGLHRIGRNDFALSKSDQHTPPLHPALQPGTTINRFLNGLRDMAEPNGRVNQFVWACLPGPIGASRFQPVVNEPEIFASIIIRTQGRRIEELGEVLLCLAGQSNRDFEVIVIAHDVSVATQIEIERTIEGTPSWLRASTRLVRVDYGTRATLLNHGFEHARGRYVIAFDDDDLVFAHWIEAFAKLEQKHSGQVLRSICLRQDADRVKIKDRVGTRAISAVKSEYAEEFSFIEHLSMNSTPFMSVAFPRSLYRDIGMRFDESLTTTEDWDFLMRAASLVGVADSKEVTAMYRGWVTQDSSRTEHDMNEWLLNQYSVDRKFDSEPLLLPRGAARAIRELVRASHAHHDSAIEAPETSIERSELQYRLADLLSSRSWRATSVLRAIARRGRPKERGGMARLLTSSTHELGESVRAIETSRSWQISRILRRG